MKFSAYHIALIAFLAIACRTESDVCSDPTSLNYNSGEECQYVDTLQHALYLKFTGTWCGPCGSWGAIKMRNTLSENENLIGVEVHQRDVMTGFLTTELVDHFNVTNYPTFVVNTGQNLSVLDQSPQVGMHVDFEIDDQSMSVTTTIKGLEAIPPGQYNLAVLLMQDGRVAAQSASDHTAYPEWEYQSGKYPKYIHKNILVKAVGHTFFGTPLTDQAIAKDQIITRTDVLDFTNTEGSLYPVAVLWSIKGGQKTVINAVSGKK